MESLKLETGVSALSELQRLYFVEGYIDPSTYLWIVSSPRTEEHHCCKLKLFSDLPILPPKLVDLWRIEGEALDLQFNQAVLHFPLIHLRDSRLGFSLEKT